MKNKTGLIIINEIFDIFKTKKVIFIFVVYLVIFFLSLKVASILELVSFVIPKLKQPLPYKVVLPFIWSIIVLPFISIFMTYDSISNDFNNKSLKYLIYRLNRKSIIVGKILSPFIILAIINFVLYLITAIHIYYRSSAQYYIQFLFLYLLTMIYCLLFIGIGLFFSIFNDAPKKSLWGALITVLIIFLTGAFQNKIFDYISPLKFASHAITYAKEYKINLVLGTYSFVGIGLIIFNIWLFKRKDIY